MIGEEVIEIEGEAPPRSLESVDGDGRPSVWRAEYVWRG